jgi:hypothetical protein
MGHDSTTSISVRRNRKAIKRAKAKYTGELTGYGESIRELRPVLQNYFLDILSAIQM